ncbi:MAG: hypothetical protein NTV52_22965 [Acidobacteria bacterium]|nr:hypothetical protein [Acidobacteriota bacterium]
MGIRTTVVLEEDVLERVRDQAREDNVPFRTKLNDLLRDGLARRANKTRVPFVVKTYSMGQFPLPFPIRVSDIDALEDDERWGKPE